MIHCVVYIVVYSRVDGNEALPRMVQMLLADSSRLTSQARLFYASRDCTLTFPSYHIV